MSVSARLVDEMDYREGGAQAGDFAWLNAEYEPASPGEEARLVFCCPCGCGGHGGCPVRRDGERTQTPEWSWNGDRERPVLSPSVFFEQGRSGEWHGYLGGSDGSRPGEWIEC